MSWRLVFVLSAFVFFIPSFAYAADYYVDGNNIGATCNDTTNNGLSITAPFCTIQKAASTAVAGDTVFIRAGTYREVVTPTNSGTSGAKITYRPYNSETVIAKASQQINTWTSLGDQESTSGNLYVTGAETGTVSEYSSTTIATGNTINVQSSIKNHGQYALETTYDLSASTADGNENNRINQNITASNDVYTRFYFRVNSDFALKANTSRHDILRVRLDSSTNRGVVSIHQNASNQLYITARTEVPSATVIYAGTPGEITKNTWHYVEFRYKGGDAATGGAEVWLNGVSKGSNYSMNTSSLQVGRIELGGNSSGATEPVDGSIIYYDDIRVSTSAIGAFQAAGNANIYRSPATVSWTVRQVFENDNRLTGVADLNALTGAGQWFRDSGTNILYLRTSDGANPSTKTIEASRFNSVFDLSNKDYITIQNLTIGHNNNTSFGAVHLLNSDGVSITSNTIKDNLGSGVFLDNSKENTISSNTYTGNVRHFGGAVRLQNGSNTNTISNNSITGIGDDGGNGIFFCGDNTAACNNTGNNSNIVSGNIITNIKDSCIYLDTKNNNNSIEKNRCSNALRNPADDSEGGNGIHIALGSSNNIIRNNIVFNVERHGISIRSKTSSNENGTDNKIINNTVYNAGTTTGNGIDVQQSSFNTTVKNNIVYKAATSPINFDPDAVATAVSDYNLFYDEPGDVVGKWNSNTYTTFVAYQAASGQDMHSLSLNPLFTNAESGNFTLQDSSPAINAGTTVSEVTDDFAGTSRPYGIQFDMGAYESNIFGSIQNHQENTTPISYQAGFTMPKPPKCEAETPHDYPDLFQIKRTNKSSIVYFTPVSEANKYYIQYGPRDNMMHGVEFDHTENKGVIGFTINELNPQVEYYYRVRSGNGCAPGPWSAIRKEAK